MTATYYPLGEAAILVSLGTKIDPAVHEAVRSLSYALAQAPFHGMIEYVAAYTNVTVFYDPVELAKEQLRQTDEALPYGFQVARQHIAAILRDMGKSAAQEARVVRVPVCYGGAYGPDLADVASYHHVSEADIVRQHTSGDYLVYMIGFAPGFPYVGGLPKAIATPRRKSPRVSIPAGSVGIAGEQTGIYPIATPGGWQIIGRTPLALFRPGNDEDPTLLHAGDKLVFYAIDEAEYQALQKAGESA
ncbi:MAG: 5-oxoprolinase subunit PxpB [Oscillospiraceae bacterium]|nr:5-oxoprolinase subunit PxpB [Oscillospiraceae bacterium]